MVVQSQSAGITKMKKRMTFGEEIAQKEPPSVILDLQSVSQAPGGVGRCSYAAGWTCGFVPAVQRTGSPLCPELECQAAQSKRSTGHALNWVHWKEAQMRFTKNGRIEKSFRN